jgi:hypothetical protein
MNFNRYKQENVTVGRKRTELKGFNQVDLSTHRYRDGWQWAGKKGLRGNSEKGIVVGMSNQIVFKKKNMPLTKLREVPISPIPSGDRGKNNIPQIWHQRCISYGVNYSSS